MQRQTATSKFTPTKYYIPAPIREKSAEIVSKYKNEEVVLMVEASRETRLAKDQLFKLLMRMNDTCKIISVHVQLYHMSKSPNARLNAKLNVEKHIEELGNMLLCVSPTWDNVLMRFTETIVHVENIIKFRKQVGSLVWQYHYDEVVKKHNFAINIYEQHLKYLQSQVEQIYNMDFSGYWNCYNDAATLSREFSKKSKIYALPEAHLDILKNRMSADYRIFSWASEKYESLQPATVEEYVECLS